MENLPTISEETLLNILRKCNGGIAVDRNIYPFKLAAYFLGLCEGAYGCHHRPRNLYEKYILVESERIHTTIRLPS
jgi:hypothetical protein